MTMQAKQASSVELKVVVAFVGEEAVEDDKQLVAALLGVDSANLDVRQFKHMSNLLDGAKVLATQGIKIDLVVYLTDHWMSHSNSTVLRKHVGADGLLYLWRGVSSLLVSVNDYIAIVQTTRDSTPAMLCRMFTAAAYLGGWPKKLTAQ